MLQWGVRKYVTFSAFVLCIDVEGKGISVSEVRWTSWLLFQQQDAFLAHVEDEVDDG